MIQKTHINLSNLMMSKIKCQINLIKHNKMKMKHNNMSNKKKSKNRKTYKALKSKYKVSEFTKPFLIPKVKSLYKCNP